MGSRASSNDDKRNSNRNSHVHPRHDLSFQTGNSSLCLTENTANLKGWQVTSTGVPRSRERTLESRERKARSDGTLAGRKDPGASREDACPSMRGC